MPPLPTERLILGLPGRVVFGLLVLFAIVAFVYSVSRRDPGAARRARRTTAFTRIGERIRKTLEYAFAQKRMFRDFYAGVFHILIFGGFVVLTVRTLALVVEGLVPGFVLLPGRAGRRLHAGQGRLRGARARRRRAWPSSAAPSRGPKRLDLTLDAWLILFLIALLMVDGPRRRGRARRRSRPALATPLGAGGRPPSRAVLAGVAPGDAPGALRRRAGGSTSSTSSSSATTCRTRSTSTSSRRSRTSSS